MLGMICRTWFCGSEFRESNSLTKMHGFLPFFRSIREAPCPGEWIHSLNDSANIYSSVPSPVLDTWETAVNKMRWLFYPWGRYVLEQGSKQSKANTGTIIPGTEKVRQGSRGWGRYLGMVTRGQPLCGGNICAEWWKKSCSNKELSCTVSCHNIHVVVTGHTKVLKLIKFKLVLQSH